MKASSACLCVVFSAFVGPLSASDFSFLFPLRHLQQQRQTVANAQSIFYVVHTDYKGKGTGLGRRDDGDLSREAPKSLCSS